MEIKLLNDYLTLQSELRSAGYRGRPEVWNKLSSDVSERIDKWKGLIKEREALKQETENYRNYYSTLRATFNSVSH